VPVSGYVTLDGKPLAGAAVQFHPASSGGRPAVGRTDEEGHFSLTTIKPEDGVLPGTYKVTVTAWAPTKAAEVSQAGQVKITSAKDFDVEKIHAPFVQDTAAKSQPTARSLVPAAYSNAEKSPWWIKVPVPGEVWLEMKGDGP
jgi:hypothetical protein